jgi:sodium/potassium/calcium exchanger 6
MAFGNGAPDIFSTFASVQAGEYQQAFGQVVGATAFISLCITGFLSIGGWVIGYQVYRRPFLKDVGILAMAVCLVFFVVHDFKIEPWEPYFCLILYLGFILLTVIARIIFQRQKIKQVVKETNTERTGLMHEVNPDNVQIEIKIHEPVGYIDDKTSKPEDVLHQPKDPESESSEGDEIETVPNLLDDEDTPMLTRLDHLFEWSKKSPFQKIIFCIKAPLLILEHLSIPSAEDEFYFRPFYILQPFFMMLIIFFAYNLFDYKLFSANAYLGTLPMWIFPICLIFSIILYKTTANSRPPVYHPLFILLGLFMSIIWISTVADELVLCLGVIGEIMGVPKAILGLTVLAWGNSIGDFVSNILIARKGYPAIATSAVYSSPITHLLLGLGISFIWKTKDGPLDLSTKDLTNSLFLNFLFVIGGLLFTLIAIPVAGFRFTRFAGGVLLAIYVVAIVIILLDVTHVILGDIELWTL